MPKPERTGSPCQVLYIDRGQARLCKGRYTANVGVVKLGMFKSESFYLNDTQVPLHLEAYKGLAKLVKKTYPLFIVDAKTAIALEYKELGDVEKDEKGQDKTEKETLNTIDPKTRQPKKIIVETPVYKKERGTICFFPRAEPAIVFKLSVLSKTAFWEMLGKMFKIKLMSVLIYMGAGAGLALVALDIVSVIFLKKHLFG